MKTVLLVPGNKETLENMPYSNLIQAIAATIWGGLFNVMLKASEHIYKK